MEKTMHYAKLTKVTYHFSKHEIQEALMEKYKIPYCGTIEMEMNEEREDVWLNHTLETPDGDKP